MAHFRTSVCAALNQPQWLGRIDSTCRSESQGINHFAAPPGARESGEATHSGGVCEWRALEAATKSAKHAADVAADHAALALSASYCSSIPYAS